MSQTAGTQAAGEDQRTEEGHRSVGRNVTKTDVVDKVRGRAKYASDRTREGLLHGAIVHSNQSHGIVQEVDTEAAAALEGVVAVVPRSELMGEFDDRVRHYGDIVAAVAAEDSQTAEEAAQLVGFDIEPLEPVYDPREAFQADAPTLHGEDQMWEDPPHEFTVENDDYQNNVDDYHSFERGDVEEGFAEADFVLESEYVSPRVKPCNLDTQCCIAKWDDDVLTFEVTLTSPDPQADHLAEFLGLEPEQVVIEPPPTGSSSFGVNANAQITVEPVAATLATITERPVKVWFDREEEFIATDHRHQVQFDITMGVTDDGDITALELEAVADTGAYPNWIGHIVLMNCMERALDLYRIPNYRYEGVSVFTNNLIGGEYRGIGSTQLGFVLDVHVDEVARQAGLDPLELRRKNFVEAGDELPHSGNRIGSCGLEECVERGLERFEAERQGPSDDPETVVGWGLSAGTHTTGTVKAGPDRAEGRIELTDDGRVTVSSSALDQGQGSDTVTAQIVSEETGIDTRYVDVRRVPTSDDLLGDMGSVASRTTWIVGRAMKNAAEEFDETIRTHAAEELGVQPADVALDGREIRAPSGDSLTLAELATAVGPEAFESRGTAESELRPPAYGVHLAEVAIDTKTGQTEVLTYVAAQDVGFAINPKMVEGQIEGSVLHGLEYALYSEVKLDRGKPQNANLADYPVVSPHEMPDTLACEIIESNEEDGPYGAKGVGTTAMPPIAPAILNALRDATGERFAEPPVEPEEIFEVYQ